MPPDFQPGFRLDAKDIAVLLLGTGAIWLIQQVDVFLAAVVGLTVGHFFLFCNVLRMARRFELLWATLFTVLSASTIAWGIPSAAVTVSLVLFATMLVAILQMRDPSYHGVGWRQLNPGLPNWWAARNASVSAEHQGQENWSQKAQTRGCYCGLWDTAPDTMQLRGLPLGYCGKCDRCGAPGHTRHFPGPLPITGAWCDRCYRIVKWTAPLRTPVGFLAMAILVGVVWGLWPDIIKALGKLLG